MVVPGFVDTEVFANSKEMGMALREDENNPYRQTMFDLEAFTNKQLENAATPDQVAEAVVAAATARRPRE
ncbi:MAG: hypothetical protein AAF499_05095, partial [Pseudomonadota bacterium]